MSPTPDAVARAFTVGLATTIGFVFVFGTIGTAISLGARELIHWLPWAGLVVGVALAAIGLAVLAGKHVAVRLPNVRTRVGQPSLSGDLLFGVGYGTASLSCTLPVFLAATGTAVTGGVGASALSYVAYALGMGTILTALAIAAALSRRGLALALRRVLPYVQRASGLLLLLAGAYVVYYWAFFLLPDSETRTGRGVIERGEHTSSRLATWLSSDTGKTTATVAFAALVALALWAAWHAHQRDSAAGSARRRRAASR